MGTTLKGPRTWSVSRDRDGEREYTIKYYVLADSVSVGPAEVLATTGLPAAGDSWSEPGAADIYATCKLDAEVVPLSGVQEGEPFQWWLVTFKFSTKADDERCKDQQIDNPLLRPQEISGGFTKYQEEATIDRNGLAITNSAFEQFKGPQIEFDHGRPTVKINQNVPLLELSLITSMQDTVNDASLWGLPARCIKLTNISWEKKYYGLCFAYYQRTFEFDIRFDTFDRDLLDEGTKVLHGHWATDTSRYPAGAWVLDTVATDTFIAPDPTNPADFDRFKDRQGENATVILDGSGQPSGVPLGTGTSLPPGYIHVEFYQQSNFLLLGVPTTF